MLFLSAQELPDTTEVNLYKHIDSEQVLFNRSLGV